MTAPLLLDGRRILLGSIIDYAGLFPPASLDMEAAVAEYRAARSGPHSWMLGRFICTASRLEELAGVLTATMTAGETPWAISVVLDGDIATAAARAQSFDAHMGNAAEIVMTETKLTSGGMDAASVKAIAQTATSVSSTVTAFLEIPRTPGRHEDIPEAVSAIADAGRSSRRSVGAKLRCGGPTREMIPAPAQIARFLIAVHAAEIPSKMTAGLHHPVRHRDPGLDVMQHGFLNILAAHALAATGSGEPAVTQALECTDPASFRIGRTGFEWDGHRIGVPTIRTLRDSRFPSFGSCSFAEPTADLLELGVLPI